MILNYELDYSIETLFMKGVTSIHTQFISHIVLLVSTTACGSL